ncbi:MAG: hypothetical protein J5630_04310 [Bacteroidaceae bacterium]|nr:hypothetical protein [Bacteroidaceae bacterium]
MRQRLSAILALLLTAVSCVWAGEQVTYVERTWDSENKKVVETEKTVNATLITSSTTTLDADGAYYVSGDFVVGETKPDHLAVAGGTVTLILCDNCILITKYLEVPEGATLKICGQKENNGMLTADGKEKNRAGIGNIKSNGNSGNIYICGGNITAYGGEYAAGIGGGSEKMATLVEILGGTVNATGGHYGAGIGSGNNSSSGQVVIHGGNVKAYGGGKAAGIGSGDGENGFSYVVIDGGDITIDGGEVTAVGGSLAAGIGGGNFASGKTVTISGGIVTATGGSDGAGIGCGCATDGWSYPEGDGGVITIDGGEVTANGGSEAAGIGGGYYRCHKDIVINDGIVTANGGFKAAGIGSGSGEPMRLDESGTEIETKNSDFCGRITINGGTVKAISGLSGAGIGGGHMQDSGEIIINGGNVEAYAAEHEHMIDDYEYAAGIGAGFSGGAKVTSIQLNGGTIKAYTKKYDETDATAFGSSDFDEKDHGWSKFTVASGMCAMTSDGTLFDKDKLYLMTQNTEVIVSECTHPNHTYAISGNKSTDTHTEQCKYCNTEFQAEQHQVAEGKCSICGTTIDDPTGVDEVKEFNDSKVQNLYDLQGRRLSDKPSRKGLYIKGNKKVLVK